MRVAGRKKGRDDCMLCGAPQPPGHVLVRDPDKGRIEGRVCSSHTLSEVIMDRSDRFMVEITVDPGTKPFSDAVERVHARHEVPYGEWVR